MPVEGPERLHSFRSDDAPFDPYAFDNILAYWAIEGLLSHGERLNTKAGNKRLTFPTELNHQITKVTGEHRTRLNIIADILEIAIDEPLKTQIMYRANLSHAQLKSYLSNLLEMGLLAVVTDPRYGRPRFRVTEKGVQFLKDYARLNRLLRE